MTTTSPLEHHEYTRLVDAAIRAPSSHNTQPWLFRVHEDGIDVCADRTRALPANDPYDRELTISCGAALFNLRVTAAHSGFAVAIELLPDAGEPDLLARVQVQPGQPDPQLKSLSTAIPERRTTREAFADASLPNDLLECLTAAANVEGADLIPVEDEVKRRIAALVAEGNRLQFANASWRRELASWIHPRRQGDGIAAPALIAPVSHFVVRHFDLGDRMAAQDERLAQTAPFLGVMATKGDTPVDWLTAGQALERVLLTAASHGAQAGYLNQPCQIESLRPQLTETLAREGVPQLVIRLGIPPAPLKEAARRPLSEVLLAEDVRP